MASIEAVVSDLEWLRLRRRIARHRAEALVLNCVTWVIIRVLKLFAR